jgi:SpoVK/Ycf46/Vps4 family AAA+-type ATPase
LVGKVTVPPNDGKIFAGSIPMATAEQIKALIRSHAEGDEERFFSIAIQMAAHAARTGHSRLATELRELIDEAKRHAPIAAGRARPIPVVQPRGDLAGLLSVSYPKVRFDQMILALEPREKLQRVVREQKARDRLRTHGLAPQRKLLLVGAPGTGKTMTAHALAGELGVALFTVELHGLITKFMGETAAKLRMVFDAVKQTRAVYLFDEFDALGGDRSSANDVAEMRRVLNSFLVMLEQDDSDSLLIAATNHPQMLDHALFRRFDATVHYPLPTADDAIAVMRSRLAALEPKSLDWRAVGEAAQGLSHAEIGQACDAAAKEAILSEQAELTTDSVVAALRERQSTRR